MPGCWSAVPSNQGLGPELVGVRQVARIAVEESIVEDQRSAGWNIDAT
jgi:hypothetical protein